MSVTEEETIDLDSLRDHSSIKRGFAYLLNIVEPEHTYFTKDNLYPIKTDQIRYSHKKSTSAFYASCGPQSSIREPVFFAADKKAFKNKSAERVLSIYVHELTHLKIGRHSDHQSGSHPPIFWREFGFNAHKAIDGWSKIERKFDTSLSQEDFIGNIVSNEVNRFNIDRRYDNVRNLRQQVARWFEKTLQKSVTHG